MLALRLNGIPDLTDHVVMDDRPIAFHGVTFKGTWNTPYESSPVAVRFMNQRAKHGEQFRRKIKVWARLQNEHILPLLGLCHGYGTLPGLVSPWMDNGSLMYFLFRRYKTLTRYECFRLLEDVASALQYLHAIAVVHGNLTSFTVLVDSHGRGFVRGSGLSMMLDEIAESEAVDTHLADVRWKAPELVVGVDNSSSRLPTSKSDVWSFGCIMIHVLSGQVPWSDFSSTVPNHELPLAQEISKRRYLSFLHNTSESATCVVQNHVPPLPQDISKQDLSFLQQCFSLRPADRPSADQILGFHTSYSRDGIPDVITEFNRRVSDQMPTHLIYIPEMRLVSRDELAAILKPEMVTEEDISRCGGWSRQFTIESKLIPGMLKYAILSHRWGESEPTFEDLKSRKCEGPGYAKLLEFCRKAEEHGCLLAWSDTCCINKESSSELDEAIRSMYRWYRDAYICIVHLAQSESLETLGIDEWFIRSWTLQELLASPRMKFYGPGWTPLTQNENDKDDAAFVFALSRVTKIPPNDLCSFRPGPNRAWEKMTWAANRKTTRIEDIAYSLIGIFDISMTISYGEGDRAFKRFMTELIQNCKEWQIIVWAGGLPGCPTEPACYRTGSEVALDMLKNRQISWWGEGRGDSDFSITKRGVQVRLLMVPVSVDQSFGQSAFQPMGPLESSPFGKLVVQSHSFPPASTTEWAIGIVNYHDHRDADQGKLKLGENYICFLLRRFRRPGMDMVRNHWRREVTEEVLTVSCARDVDEILETVWL
ncbi:hypothetical protein AZE42_07404 [Rhizopogon vesiculosus]|uniref:Protein kinase domain-containing protein n=1 Tax=Rhizopogon vesiculosus TaxID=180088 RepID=A0A1J8Q230_9AGAM|nr:hypothetical protein AZE42_07404 [Rhizopogon vesiculosus]